MRRIHWALLVVALLVVVAWLLWPKGPSAVGPGNAPAPGEVAGPGGAIGAPPADSNTPTVKIKLLGVAIINWLDGMARGKVTSRPPGAGPPATSSLPPEQRLSWVSQLLPYIGRADLSGQLHGAAITGEDIPWDDPKNRPVVDTVLDLLITPEMQSRSLTRDGDGRALAGYVGVGGVGPDAPTSPPDAGSKTRGLFSYARPARLEEVKDGLSNTAAVFEVRRDFGPWARNGAATVRPIEAFEGGLVLMADGSVRSLPAKADPKVLRSMATIAAGD